MKNDERSFTIFILHTPSISIKTHLTSIFIAIIDFFFTKQNAMVQSYRWNGLKDRINPNKRTNHTIKHITKTVLHTILNRFMLGLHRCNKRFEISINTTDIIDTTNRTRSTTMKNTRESSFRITTKDRNITSSCD